MSLSDLMLKIKGGPGSGNKGHAGRPGKRGGSSSKSFSITPQMDQAIAQWKQGKEYYHYFLARDIGKSYEFSGNDILKERKEQEGRKDYDELNKFIEYEVQW